MKKQIYSLRCKIEAELEFYLPYAGCIIITKSNVKMSEIWEKEKGVPEGGRGRENRGCATVRVIVSLCIYMPVNALRILHIYKFFRRGPRAAHNLITWIEFKIFHIFPLYPWRFSHRVRVGLLSLNKKTNVLFIRATNSPNLNELVHRYSKNFHNRSQRQGRRNSISACTVWSVLGLLVESIRVEKSRVGRTVGQCAISCIYSEISSISGPKMLISELLRIQLLSR